MIYYKTSQPVPGKGEAWMFYECDDDQRIRRYLTYIPATRETDKVPNPFIKKLQRPEMLMPAERDEFYQYWGEDEADVGPHSAGSPEVAEAVKQKRESEGKHFHPDMTIAEAMGVHPQVAEVFAAFHLGGCGSCGVSEFETVAQVCMGYGVDVDMLLDVLEGLMDEEEAKTSTEAESPAEVEG